MRFHGLGEAIYSVREKRDVAIWLFSFDGGVGCNNGTHTRPKFDAGSQRYNKVSWTGQNSCIYISYQSVY